MPDTIRYMYEGFLYLVNRNIRHIEVNFGMGNIANYDIEVLISQYTYIIDFILARYEDYDFSVSYVILDRILQRMFLNTEHLNQCSMPFKIEYDGTIRSCDRIRLKDNNIIGNIMDKSLSYNTLSKAHRCRNYTVKRCNVCDYRQFCVPCILYVDSPQNKIEPYFCTITKLLISKAIFFYNKKKNDIKTVIRFNSNIRRRIISKDYAVKSSST